jgi:hypothetical protein
MNLLVFASRDKKTTIIARGTMKEAGEGKLLSEQIELGRQMAFDFLKAPSPGVKLSAETAAIFRKAFENVKIETRDGNITASAEIPAEAIQALVDLLSKSVMPDQ